MNVKHKLEVFSKAALAEARERSDAILKKLDDDYASQCQKAAAEAAAASAAYIETERKRLYIRRNQDIANAKHKARRQLDKTRSDLTDELFETIRAKLVNHAISDDGYLDALLSRIESVTNRYGTDIALCLTPADKKRLEARLNAAGLDMVAFVEPDPSMIGGFRAYIKDAKISGIDPSSQSPVAEPSDKGAYNAILDMGFDTLLRRERESFTGLQIYR